MSYCIVKFMVQRKPVTILTGRELTVSSLMTA